MTPLSVASAWHALVGGLLIGLAAATLLVASGRIAGISGIVGAAVAKSSDARGWRLWFLAGLVGTGALLAWWRPALFGAPVVGPVALIGAGLLVGFGTTLGSGCTSGHGVCGIGRGSVRSLVATLLFMASGAATVFVVRHVLTRVS